MNLYALLLMAVVGAPVLGSCSKHEQPASGAAAPAAVVTGTAVETVHVAAAPETIEVSGTVRAHTSAVVSARIPGTVSIIKVREGDRVKKGQLLAQLEAQESLAGAAGASAAIEEAERGVEEARSRRKLADVTFERFQKLFAEQAVTRQEFDVKQADRDLAAQGVARAEARLKQAREGARAAGAMADYTRIVAPISGIVTMKQADLGATVFPAQPLMTIEDEASYQLDLAVPESVGGKVKPGTPVQVTVDTLGATFAARIAEVVPAADPASRTFTAKVNLARQGLKSGLFGRGAISLGTTVNVLTVPRRAVVERGALTSIWVVDKDRIARMRLVKPGKTMGERVEILSGLADGERVVVTGMEKVSDGARVE